MALLMRKSATKNASITASQSTTLVKNLFRAAFSSVAYIRGLFEDDCFQLCRIGTTRYHKIVSLERDDVKNFVGWLEEGIFDALQKKYLEVVFLEIYQEPAAKKSKKKNAAKRNLLECYTFNVSYSDGKPQLAVTGNGSSGIGSSNLSKEQIKQTTGAVLRSLVQLTSLLDPLPVNRVLSMKLFYTKNTPAEYEPPLFRKAADGEACWFEETPSCMEAGAVTTPFHQLSMTIKAGMKTAGKEKCVDSGKDKADAGISAVSTGKQEKKEQKDGRASPELDQGTAIIDVGSSNANSGRVGKSSLTESQEIEVDAGKFLPFDLNQSGRDTKNKNRSGTKKKGGSGTKNRSGPGRKDGAEAKVGGSAQTCRKRKMSVTDKDISQKRQRGKKTAQALEA